ncbi:efhand [Nesidiocoris tenuis]|uniref:Efhand n=1 Tax=Nesidiocoris tenuis TaxID=355587 RepID=A0ABN7B6U9_9HEMI|nr:efhand [Nesidiocoris tenuis]
MVKFQNTSDPSTIHHEVSKPTIGSAASLTKWPRKSKRDKRVESQASTSTTSSTYSDFEPLVDFSQFQPHDESGIAAQSDRTGVISYSGLFEFGGDQTEKKIKLTAKRQRQKALKKGGWIRPMRIDLKPYQLEDLRDAFNELQDKAELMSVDKIQTIIRASGYEPESEEVKELVDGVSPETEGFITYTEMVEIYKAKLKKEDAIDEIRRAFRLFDLDNKKAITLDNLKQIAKMTCEDLTDEELQEMLDAVDSNNSGSVTMENFVKFMKRMEYFDQE